VTAVVHQGLDLAESSAPGGPLHLRLPAATARIEGIAGHICAALEAAGARRGDLLVELPLPVLAGEGAGRLVATLKEAGIGIIAGDWDTSAAGMRLAARGDLAMAKLSLSKTSELLFQPETAALWRAGFASLGALGVPLVVRGVCRPEETRWLFDMGVAAVQGPAVAARAGGSRATLAAAPAA
jgi:EAL domain-containing protein (putative c-di-GMP-specific phosphodiesterase class I)